MPKETLTTNVFDEWWDKEGRLLSWGDLKDLAQAAFEAGMIEGNCGECGAHD